MNLSLDLEIGLDQEQDLLFYRSSASSCASTPRDPPSTHASAHEGRGVRARPRSPPAAVPLPGEGTTPSVAVAGTPAGEGELFFTPGAIGSSFLAASPVSPIRGVVPTLGVPAASSATSVAGEDAGDDEDEFLSPREHPSTPVPGTPYHSAGGGTFMDGNVDLDVSLEAETLLYHSAMSRVLKGLEADTADEDEEPPEWFYERAFLGPPTERCTWRLYCAQLAPTITLVLLGDHPTSKDGRAEDRVVCDRVRSHVLGRLENFIDFLVIKAQAHITMLSYLYFFPGLVHFILVDRTHGYVTTPTIIPLHGELSGDAPPADTGALSVQFIQRRVWEMCLMAQEQLRAGYTTMLVKKKGFLYAHQVWLEDSEGSTLPLCVPPQRDADVVFDDAFFSGLVESQYPKSRSLQCFELFSLYVGTLTCETVARFNESLARMVRANNTSRVSQTLHAYTVQW